MPGNYRSPAGRRRAEAKREACSQARRGLHSPQPLLWLQEGLSGQPRPQEGLRAIPETAKTARTSRPRSTAGRLWGLNQTCLSSSFPRGRVVTLTFKGCCEDLNAADTLYTHAQLMGGLGRIIICASALTEERKGQKGGDTGSHGGSGGLRVPVAALPGPAPRHGREHCTALRTRSQPAGNFWGSATSPSLSGTWCG